MLSSGTDGTRSFTKHKARKGSGQVRGVGWGGAALYRVPKFLGKMRVDHSTKLSQNSNYESTAISETLLNRVLWQFGAMINNAFPPGICGLVQCIPLT